MMIILFSSSNGEENYSVQSNLIVEGMTAWKSDSMKNENYNQFIFSWSFEMTKVLRVQISKLVNWFLTDEMYVYKINLNLQYLE